MMGFIHSFETSLLNLGFATLGGRRQQQQVRVIRQTSRRSTAKVLAALTATRAERDALAAENASLRREVERLRLVAGAQR